MAEAKIETVEEMNDRRTVLHQRIRLAEFVRTRGVTSTEKNRVLCAIAATYRLELEAMEMRDDLNTALRAIEEKDRG